jgi:glycosyltransferase involved in cell wall biosynthesis
LRILIATSHRGLVGGVERYLQAVIPALVERGHHVALLFEFPFDSKQERIDAPELRLPAWFLTELGIEAALGSVGDWKPDIVYSQGLETLELESALLDRYPTVMYAHNYYGTCISGRKCHSFPRAEPCAREMGPLCLALYYPRRCGGVHPGTMWRMFRQQSERKSRLTRYQAVLVASRHMYEEFQQHGVSPGKLHLAPLSTTENTPDQTAPVSRVPGGELLFVGRLTDLKGAAYLIQALPQAAKLLARPLTLIVAGDGKERRSLENLACRLGVAVEFTGWVHTQQKADLMRHADLLVVPSLWPEPFGLVGIEAGGFGLPAVSFALGGIPEWLVPGRTGESAAGHPPTPEGLAHAIARALSDANHYNELRRGAWEMARRFTLESHLAKLDPILILDQPADCATGVRAAN